MPKAGIRDVTDENPSDFENTFPLVGSPDRTASGIVHLSAVIVGSMRWNVTLCAQKSLTGVSISAMPQKWPLKIIYVSEDFCYVV